MSTERPTKVLAFRRPTPAPVGPDGPGLSDQQLTDLIQELRENKQRLDPSDSCTVCARSVASARREGCGCLAGIHIDLPGGRVGVTGTYAQIVRTYGPIITLPEKERAADG